MYEVNQSTQFIYSKQSSNVSSLLYLTATSLHLLYLLKSSCE